MTEASEVTEASDLQRRCDFPTESVASPANEDELVEALRAAAADGLAVRLCGHGSRQRELPPPRREDDDASPPRVQLLSLAGLSAITRLEPDDLTCSVQAGLSRIALDEELTAHGLELQCGDRGGVSRENDGTVGGLFASGRDLPGVAGGSSTRSTLLGVRGCLAEGLCFKAGSRVVKSVAGFDLQKVFVGSRGRLFAVTELHLKLRRRPALRLAFCRDSLDLQAARSLLLALRAAPFPAETLRLDRRLDGSCRVLGQFAGARAACEQALQVHGLEPLEVETRLPQLVDTADWPAERERIDGAIRPSRCVELAELDDSAELSVHGSGAFTMWLPDGVSADSVLERLPALGASGCVTHGAATRRLATTPLDSGAELLTHRLREALDPAGMLL